MVLLAGLSDCFCDDFLDEDYDNDFDEIIDSDEDEDYYIDEISKRPMHKRKGVNKSEEFCKLCGSEFEELISIPMIALCKHNHELIPYEYSNRILRFKRNDDDIDEFLRNRAKRLVMYCLKNKISKDLLKTVAGGNLYDYFQMKNSYGF